MLCSLMVSVLVRCTWNTGWDPALSPGEHHKKDSSSMSAQFRSLRTVSYRIDKTVSILRLSQLFRNDVLA